MDWIGPLLEQYGLPGAIIAVLVVVLWRWSKTLSDTTDDITAIGKASSNQVDTALKLVGSFQEMVDNVLKTISKNTAAIETMVVRMEKNNKDHLEALAEQLEKMTVGASMERTAHSKHLDDQFAQVMDKLETLQQTVDSGIMSAEARALFVEMETLLREIKAAVITSSTSPIAKEENDADLDQ